jgi:hypothetical protein
MRRSGKRSPVDAASQARFAAATSLGLRGLHCCMSKSSLICILFRHPMSRTIMSTHRIRFLVRPLILATAISSFSAYGFTEDADFGKTDYESSCAACHGKNGKGDGPVSRELRTRPSDLTLIAKNNGGVFPSDVLYRIIDGRRTIRAHGNYEMPVWGSAFLGPEDAGRKRIMAIIDYLKSIQLR